MMIEICGKVAKYRVENEDGITMDLCTIHFSNVDVQYLITRKILVYERLKDWCGKCQEGMSKRDREKVAVPGEVVE